MPQSATLPLPREQFLDHLIADKKFLKWADNDASEEKEKSAGIISTYQLQLKETEEKSLLNSKIKEVSQNGVEWLEPFQFLLAAGLGFEPR